MKISFIGIGAMGSPMVERLLTGQFAVTVFNRPPEKAEPLIKLGAKNALSLEKAVADADVVMTCLTTMQ